MPTAFRNMLPINPLPKWPKDSSLEQMEEETEGEMANRSSPEKWLLKMEVLWSC